MSQHREGYAWQELFLGRSTRLAALYREWLQTDAAPDSRGVLLAWAVCSTLADCRRLGVEEQARGLREVVYRGCAVRR